MDEYAVPRPIAGYLSRLLDRSHLGLNGTTERIRQRTTPFHTARPMGNAVGGEGSVRWCADSEHASSGESSRKNGWSLTVLMTAGSNTPEMVKPRSFNTAWSLSPSQDKPEFHAVPFAWASAVRPPQYLSDEGKRWFTRCPQTDGSPRQ